MKIKKCLSPPASWLYQEKRACSIPMESGITNQAKDRADAQRLVATRLLDRLHDPLGHFSRLQRIYPRLW